MRKPNLVPILSALDYYISHEWKRPDPGDDDISLTYDATALELEKLARKDSLTIWGKADLAAGGHVPIAARAWEEMRIDRQSMLEETAQTQYRREKQIYAYPTYYFLAVDTHQLEALIPPIGWFGKLVRNMKKKRKRKRSSTIS